MGELAQQCKTGSALWSNQRGCQFQLVPQARQSLDRMAELTCGVQRSPKDPLVLAVLELSPNCRKRAANRHGAELLPMRFPIFPLHLWKVLRLPRKSDARSYIQLSREIILANLKRLQNATPLKLSRDQRPYLVTSLMNMSLVLRLPGEMHLPRSSSKVPRLPLFLEMRRNPHVLLTFGKVLNPLRLPRETTSERPKADGTCGAFNILTWTCASPHNGVRIFDVSTSKSVQNLVCFLHFDLEMCFAPQLRALFRHLNFQKWSETISF